MVWRRTSLSPLLAELSAGLSEMQVAFSADRWMRQPNILVSPSRHPFLTIRNLASLDEKERNLP
jgi:hypothetical protein